MKQQLKINVGTCIFSILLFLTSNCLSQNNTCLGFKTVKFIYTDPDYSNLITTRLDSIQVDSFTDVDWKITSKIKWFSDCLYKTEYIKVNDPIMNHIIGTKFTIEIIKIDDNKILCKSESDGITIEKQMIKIE